MIFVGALLKLHPIIVNTVFVRKCCVYMYVVGHFKKQGSREGGREGGRGKEGERGGNMC